VKHYFLDTSALVKLFASEAGADRVRQVTRWNREESADVQVLLCDLAYPECVAALRQLLEHGVGGRRGLSPAVLRKIMPELHNLFSQRMRILVVEASRIVANAAHLAARQQVKGADAVHIAAAQSMRELVPAGEEFWFVTSDARQSTAAREEGMAVLDPTA
jgi:predicted nucleic acid-binding protein